jgi:phosphorylase superfamily protein
MGLFSHDHGCDETRTRYMWDHRTNDWRTVCGVDCRTTPGRWSQDYHRTDVRRPNGAQSAAALPRDGDDGIRGEGTSYHYPPPSLEVACPTPVIAHLERELVATGWSVRSGKVWTTDAPYRETRAQLKRWASRHALAVEMQTASLFAFGIARQASVTSVAMVSNALDHQGEQFDTGSPHDGLRILDGMARAARSYLDTA